MFAGTAYLHADVVNSGKREMFTELALKMQARCFVTEASFLYTAKLAGKSIEPGKAPA